MATFYNPANRNRALSNVAGVGQLQYDYFVFSLAASYASGASADESLIEIGRVPADQVLVPHLCRLSLPVLDSNGAPTGDYEVGTAADTDVLLASRAAETAAAVIFGEDWLVPAAEIGSQTEDTPIYIRVSSVIATLGTGSIVFEQVTRPYNAAQAH
jgi:hypothetical protein